MITSADGFIPRLVCAFHDAHPSVEVEVRQYDFRDTSVGLPVPVSDLSPSLRAMAWRSGEQRAEVRTMVDAICRGTGVAPPVAEVWRG